MYEAQRMVKKLIRNEEARKNRQLRLILLQQNLKAFRYAVRERHMERQLPEWETAEVLDRTETTNEEWKQAERSSG